MNKKALILAANGTEEAELVITADILRRAEVRDLNRIVFACNMFSMSGSLKKMVPKSLKARRMTVRGLRTHC